MDAVDVITAHLADECESKFPKWVSAVLSESFMFWWESRAHEKHSPGLFWGKFVSGTRRMMTATHVYWSPWALWALRFAPTRGVNRLTRFVNGTEIQSVWVNGKCVCKVRSPAQAGGARSGHLDPFLEPQVFPVNRWVFFCFFPTEAIQFNYSIFKCQCWVFKRNPARNCLQKGHYERWCKLEKFFFFLTQNATQYSRQKKMIGIVKVSQIKIGI